MGGVVAPIVDLGDDVVSSVGDLGQDAIDTVKDAGKSIDQTVRDTLPGGWTTAALLAAGYYYSPEIGAYISSDGTSMAAASDVAAADAAATAAPVVPELTGYDAAMADLASSAPAVTGAGTAAGLGLGGSLAAGAAGAAALGSMLIPDVPGMAPAYEAKKYEPDYSIKFDDPMKQLELPESFNFQLDSAPSPYLTKSQTGQSTGGMLFDPNEQYASNLVRGLRAASDAPSSTNPGFTIYQSAKP